MCLRFLISCPIRAVAGPGTHTFQEATPRIRLIGLSPRTVGTRHLPHGKFTYLPYTIKLTKHAHATTHTRHAHSHCTYTDKLVQHDINIPTRSTNGPAARCSPLRCIRLVDPLWRATREAEESGHIVDACSDRSRLRIIEWLL